jgi:hypothetical protein
MRPILRNSLLIIVMILISSINNVASAQTDSTTAIKPDTTKPVQPDTTKPAQPAQPAPTQQEEKQETESKGEASNNEFIIYGGLNMNQLGTEDKYESESETGYQFGLAYRGGGFFYWQAGLKYNNAIYGLKKKSGVNTFTTVPIGSIDIPLAAGINILSVTDRLFGLRGFIGAVPAFTIGVSDNDLAITKDSVNSFVLYGQFGLAANVAFVVVEVGFNYGFQDMLKEETSNPGQFFVNLGFRF